MIGRIGSELRLLRMSRVLPVLLALVSLLAIANVAASAEAVGNDYALLQHTRAEYARNGMDFAADLARPERVERSGSDEVVGNLARFDYDTLATAIHDIAPASGPGLVLGYFGFLVFPVLFFLVGLWLATAERRYGTEKTTLARNGPSRTVAARQIAVLVASAALAVVTVVVDVVARAVAGSLLGQGLALAEFPPLAPIASGNPLSQAGVLLLIAVFFGVGGVAVGTLVGGFAVPALVFLAWDLVLPILAAHDPRNWLTVLGHASFGYSSGFQLAASIPLPVPVALTCVVASCAVLVAVGQVGVRVRNPLAI